MHTRMFEFIFVQWISFTLSHPCCEVVLNVLFKSGSSSSAKIVTWCECILSSSFNEISLNCCSPECIVTVEMSPRSHSYSWASCRWATGHRPTFLWKWKVCHFRFHLLQKCLPGRFVLNQLLSVCFSSFCGLLSCSRTGICGLMETLHFIILNRVGLWQRV